MKKLEAKFQTRFNHWVKAIYRKTACFELKDTRGKDYINFSEVKDHQIAALRTAKHGVLVYKIADLTFSALPFDSFCLSGVPAYVVISYASGNAYLIDVDRFVEERDSSERKSLTEERAGLISSISF